MSDTLLIFAKSQAPELFLVPDNELSHSDHKLLEQVSNLNQHLSNNLSEEDYNKFLTVEYSFVAPREYYPSTVSQEWRSRFYKFKITEPFFTQNISKIFTFI